ncbi:MAG: 50S ribosomal protein L31 [Candidatus Uhrbacteria bacterium]
MKKKTHPTYNDQATIACACGASHKIGSTQDDIQVELCSKCHPFYTGTQKIIDSARRVEKFKARDANKSAKTESKATKKATKRAKRTAKGPKYSVETTKTATVRKTLKSDN